MKSFTLAKHRSWFYSAGIALLITLWLASGMFAGEDEAGAVESGAVTTVAAPQPSVRTRSPRMAPSAARLLLTRIWSIARCGCQEG